MTSKAETHSNRASCSETSRGSQSSEDGVTSMAAPQKASSSQTAGSHDKNADKVHLTRAAMQQNKRRKHSALPTSGESRDYDKSSPEVINTGPPFTGSGMAEIEFAK